MRLKTHPFYHWVSLDQAYLPCFIVLPQITDPNVLVWCHTKKKLPCYSDSSLYIAGLGFCFIIFIGNHIYAISDGSQGLLIIRAQVSVLHFLIMALYSISKAKDTSVGADHIASAHTFFGCLGIMINPLHPNVSPHLVKLQKESVKYTKHLFL